VSDEKAKAAIPADLAEALGREPRAKARFEAMPPSHQREHMKWIEEAKKPETRARRIAKTVEKIASEA
jgi:uncharacterized protein YdeI (YjbR/CyaY-like superfamily)